MKWDEMCAGALVVGKKIEIDLEFKTNNNRRGKTALPAAGILTGLITAAKKLTLKEPPRPRNKGDKGKSVEGISFHVALCTVGPEDALSVTTAFSQFVNWKEGATVCYENSFLPLELGGGHILVHQGLAPCTRCRAGYRKWAMQRRCTIIVDSDADYDSTGLDQPTFLFTPVGLVFFG
jgi:hypothetical protein